MQPVECAKSASVHNVIKDWVYQGITLHILTFQQNTDYSNLKKMWLEMIELDKLLIFLFCFPDHLHVALKVWYEEKHTI